MMLLNKSSFYLQTDYRLIFFQVNIAHVHLMEKKLYTWHEYKNI